MCLWQQTGDCQSDQPWQWNCLPRIHSFWWKAMSCDLNNNSSTWKKNSGIFYFIQNSAICTLLIYWFIYLEGIVCSWKLCDLCSPARETPITVSLVLFLAKLKGCNSSLLLLTFLPLSWLWYFPLPCLASLSRAAFSASSQRQKINRGGSSEPESRVTRGDQEQITGSQHSSCMGSQAQCFQMIREGMSVATAMGYGMAHAYAAPSLCAQEPGVCFKSH